MFKNIVTIILHQKTTKISALILGYLTWFFIAQYQNVTHSYIIPICFYNDENIEIIAPQSIKIKIQGHRLDIFKLHQQDLAIHLDATSFHNGINEIILNKENLFLPETLKLINLIPSYISINVTSKKHE